MKRVNVLIINDSELDRYILKRQLEELGVERVFEKDDGSTALEFFNDYDKNKQRYPDAFPPNIIFLDINMPQVNGFDFLEAFAKMRVRSELASVVVCIYSSSEKQEDKERIAEYNFVDSYIVSGEVSIQYLQQQILALR